MASAGADYLDEYVRNMTMQLKLSTAQSERLKIFFLPKKTWSLTWV